MSPKKRVLTVTAAGIGIGNVTRIVANRSQTLNIRTEEKVMQIKEVVVKATKIEQHGDTVSYLVGAYQQQGDRVIGDVLRRMPGIEVKDNGSILYNGHAIKHFYVEEMDLLQGRYGIATNNINASDVARVQVMERHQAKKVLQGKDFTEDVAVNLKLKDSAKGTWAVNAMLGGGGQQTQTIGNNPLWTAEVVGMYFAKRRQNMTLYKGNNAGDDVHLAVAQGKGWNVTEYLTTGVSTVDARATVVKTVYYSLDGVCLGTEVPARGIYIATDLYSNGATRARKVVTGK